MLERIQNLRKLLALRPDWHGTELRDDSPEWIVIMWEKVLGIWQPPYVPSYRTVVGTDGQLTWPLGETEYFATKETAVLMAEKYGDTPEITEIPFGGTGGIFSVSEPEYHITVKGELKNAGLIAAVYKRYPTDTHPGKADKVIREVLGL